MERFAQLYEDLDRSTGTLAKRAALVDYFRTADPRDAVWALYLLSGGRINGARNRIAGTAELRAWSGEVTGLPAWLIDESHHHVGDLAEALTLLVPDPVGPSEDLPLADWVEGRLLEVANGSEEDRRARVLAAWFTLPEGQRLVFNKMLTGSFRVGVSRRLVQQALAELSGVDVSVIAQRLLGDWKPSPAFLRKVLSNETLPGDGAQAYPFFLASPLEGEPARLGPPSEWFLEWKWDGIRLQLIRREGATVLWSRGEERLDGRFPEIEAAAVHLPGECVLDGELLAWRAGEVQPLPFSALQTRIQRRSPGRKSLTEAPAQLLVYDLLELQGRDMRALAHTQRRRLLEDLFSGLPADLPLKLSPLLDVAGWEEAAALRAGSRGRGVEGLMLKRRSAPYRTGRPRGDWWKWKIDPHTIDAVLIYAQLGHGRRSTLHTDYTFGLWEGESLTPVAKAYSGLNDEEILELDAWIRGHTVERFGPVRAVQPQHVFELAFEAVNLSKRHKSGLAVRFPRILRWRRDKPAAQADQVATLRSLAQ